MLVRFVAVVLPATAERNRTVMRVIFMPLTYGTQRWQHPHHQLSPKLFFFFFFFVVFVVVVVVVGVIVVAAAVVVLILSYRSMYACLYGDMRTRKE
jgi:Flp pilus assembly protein TadB